MLTALDTETTGLDLRHGNRPFFISTWSDDCPSLEFRRSVPKFRSDARDPLDYWLRPGVSSSPEEAMRAAIQLPYVGGRPQTSLEGYGYNWMLDYNPANRHTSLSSHQRETLQLLLTGNTIVFHHAFFDMMANARVGVYFNFPEHPIPFSTTDLYHLPECKHFPDPNGPDSIVIDCKDFHDTMLACHVYDSKGPRGLKDAAIHYLLLSDSDEHALKHLVELVRNYVKKYHKTWELGVDLKDKGQSKYDYALPIALYHHLKKHPNPDRKKQIMELEAAMLPVIYGSLDAYRTLNLHYILQHLLEEDDRLQHYEDQRAQLVPCFKMQCVGIRLSDRMAPLRTELSKAIFHRKREVRKRAAEIAPELFKDKPFNPNSPKQLAKVLFSREGFALPPIEFTKTGQPSVGSKVRKKLAYAALDKPYRKHQQLYQFLRLITSWDGDDPSFAFPDSNTGYDAWKKSVGYLDSYKRYSIGGTVFPHFNPTGTDTTRYSSANPNGQNIGKKNRVPLRMAFGPSANWTWYAIDYSQLELRLFAAACRDTTLLSAFTDGRDFHELVACEIFHTTPDKVTSAQRTAAKYINFGLIYGAGRFKIDTLAGFAGAYDRYRGNFPSAAKYMDEIIKFAEINGYVQTLYGYPLHLGEDPAYKGVNYIVQGTAGQIVKYAMMDLGSSDDSPIDWTSVQLILNVHDELIFAVHNDYSPAEQATIAGSLCNIMARQGDRIGVTTPVECSIITTTWKEKEKYGFPAQQEQEVPTHRRKKGRAENLPRRHRRPNASRV